MCHTTSPGKDKSSARLGALSWVYMDGMSGAEEDSVFEVEEIEDEDEDGETYFRTEHVSRTEELQEVVDMAARVIRF